MPAENEIQLKITIDGKDAIATLKLTEEEIKKIKTSLDSAGPAEGINKTTKAVTTLGNVSKRDLGMFANQLLYSSGISGRLGGQLSNLASSLLMGGTIGAAFAGFAAIISLITKESEAAKKAVEELNGVIRGLIEIQTTSGTFKIAGENIPEAIRLLKEELEKAKEFGAAWLKDNPRATNIIALEESINVLEEANEKYLEQRNIINLLSDAGLTYTETITGGTKEQNIVTQTSIDLMRKQVAEFFKFWTAVKKAREEQRREQASRFNVSPVNVPDKPVPFEETTEQIIHQNFELGLLYDTNQALIESLWETGYALSQIGAEGAKAWLMNVMGIERVNSVLQQLIIAFGQAIIQALILKAVTAFLDFLFPGAGQVVEAVTEVIPIEPKAKGGAGVVTKPTLFLAGEAGPEYYNFTPLDRASSSSSSQPQHIIVHVTGELTQSGMDMRAVLNQVEETIRRNKL